MVGRSIRIFLVDGTSSGTRTAELGLSTIKSLVIPRASLSVANNRPELQKTGVYVLVGQDSENPNQKQVYIGEGDVLITRISAHNKDPGKEFWDEVVLFVSKDDNLTKAHVRYVEARLISLAKAAKRASVTNGTSPSEQGKLPEADEVEMEEFISQARILLGSLGFDIFEPAKAMVAPPAIGQQPEVAPINAEGAPEFRFVGESYDAICVVDTIAGQYIVRAGSLVRRNATPSLQPTYRNLRAQLIQNGVLVESGESQYRFSQDYAFSAPTSAAQVVCGSSANGRTAWRSVIDGSTYAEWESAQLPSAENG